MNATEVAAKGRELYDSTLKAKLESGDYEMGDEYLYLSRRLRARRPHAVPYTIRIGYNALGRMGGGLGSSRA